MRSRVWLIVVCLCFLPLSLLAQEDSQKAAAPARILLLITEQNIGSPQHAWWSSVVDLSIVESSLAQALSEAGYQVVDPESAQSVLKKEPAYRLVRMRECDMTDLANLQGAEYVIKGSAIASQGSRPPQSGMRSYYARVNARLIRVKDHMAVAAFNAWGKSVHSDAVAGGSEALEDAGRALAQKVFHVLKREGVR